jgi:hypothetical protein
MQKYIRGIDWKSERPKEKKEEEEKKEKAKGKKGRDEIKNVIVCFPVAGV